ncbi:MAG: PEP-utilizing enzyme [Patescibacteria group bacterium]
MGKQKIEFFADRISGIEGSIFALSAILELIMINNRRNIFKCVFYAQTIDDKTQKSTEWIDAAAYKKISKDVLEYINTNGAAYFEDVKHLVISEANDLFEKSKNIIGKLNLLSDFDLVQEYVKYMKLYTEYYGLGAVTFIYESELSEYLHTSLNKRHKNVAELLHQQLQSPYRSFIMEADNLLLEIKNEKKLSTRAKLVRMYLEKFYFIKTNYSGTSVLDSAVVEKMVAGIDEHSIREKQATKITTGVALSPEENNLIQLFRETEIIRDQRKRINLIGTHTMFRFLNEMCERKKIPFKIARRMFWFEFSDSIYNRDRLMEKLDKRKEATGVVDGQNVYYLDYTAVKSRETLSQDITEFHGTPASKGKIRAKARVIFGSADFSKFQEGEVLVTEMTRPDFISVMKQSAAIITDEGGLTSHAAIIARELKKPCIIGTKIATQVLKDGDLVEVDADHGVVRILKRV